MYYYSYNHYFDDNLYFCQYRVYLYNPRNWSLKRKSHLYFLFDVPKTSSRQWKAFFCEIETESWSQYFGANESNNGFPIFTNWGNNVIFGFILGGYVHIYICTMLQSQFFILFQAENQTKSLAFFFVSLWNHIITIYDKSFFGKIYLQVNLNNKKHTQAFYSPAKYPGIL